MGRRKSLTRFFLWIAVLAGGPLLGAKVFDLVVLAGAWSASPPESLRLLPYGADYPVDTGEFFIPSSAAMLFASFAALASGWTAPLRYRGLLALNAVGIFGILVLTVIVFWPMNAALWAYANGASGATQSAAEITDMARRWVALDWVRVGVASLGFIAAVRALSIPYPEERAPADPPIVKFGLLIALAGVAAFLVYFVVNI